MPYIYLIHCRASVNAKENVYKIGKSGDFNKRLDGYDKGSIPIFTIYVSECDNFEKLLITLFRSKFTVRADYGTEYFEGNVSSMINSILEEYNKTELSYNIKNVIETEPLQKIETTINIIKTKTQLKNKLNKVNIQNLNDFQMNMTMNSTEFNNNQYYCMLNNSIQNYRMDKIGGRTKLKFGDYLEYNYAFINNLCSSLLSINDTNTVKLIERIKISI